MGSAVSIRTTRINMPIFRYEYHKSSKKKILGICEINVQCRKNTVEFNYIATSVNYKKYFLAAPLLLDRLGIMK